MKGILREPLLHFMLVGVALFVAFEWARDDAGAPDDEIRVDQAALVRFLTQRDPRLDADMAAKALAAMSGERREALIEEHVREEVLFRQARAMGLDGYDYVGRRRLIAQLDYINRGFIEANLQFSDDALSRYHEANKERYFVPPKITFTHVFFSVDIRGQDAKTDALVQLGALNEYRVPFHEGPSRGDVFLYHKNYVAKEREEIDSHFGTAFAATLFDEPPSERWIGPIASDYGFHVVMVAARAPGYSPPLAEVRPRVVQDLAVERTRVALDNYYQDARSGYDIVIEMTETTR